MTALEPRRVKVQGDLFHGRIPDGAVYVGRPAPNFPGSPFQNRHPVGNCRRCSRGHADQASAVSAFAHDLDSDPGLAVAARRDLAGRDLACWCKEPPCHGDVLVLVAAGVTPLDALQQLGLEETK